MFYFHLLIAQQTPPLKNSEDARGEGGSQDTTAENKICLKAYETEPWRAWSSDRWGDQIKMKRAKAH